MKASLIHALALSCSLWAVTANAATEEKATAKRVPSAHASPGGFIPVRGARLEVDLAAPNLTYHGGPVITSAKVVFIFWGPSFTNAASPDFLYAHALQSFRNQFGTTPEYNVITQYSGIQLANLGAGTPDLYDSSTPPTNVTDAIVQSEVNSYLASFTFDASTIYEVVIPSTSYYTSPSGGTSCGGPNLALCARHSWIGGGASAIKYSIQPYPSCGGCQLPGWSDVQNQEHFVCHETREAVTDQQGSAWFDSSGNEADDKCAWSPTPFIGTGGYGYQYEWSNAASACVQTMAITGAPSVTTTPASGISSSGATLHGAVDPQGESTNAYFQWGTTTGYGNTTFNQNVGSGTVSVPYSVSLSGLSCGTIYHFQAAATNNGGTGLGGDQAFTTSACPARFFTAIPCRLIDTRGSFALGGGVTYEVGVAGFCGIPSTATSVSVNITAVDATTGGSLAFWPAQTSNPGTSTINFSAGQVRANNAILLLAPGFFGSPAAVWVEFGGAGSVDLVIDINGYFQ
jgi:hypothetical protein